MRDEYRYREVGQMVRSDEHDIDTGNRYSLGYGLILQKIEYEDDPKFVEQINEDVAEQSVCTVSNTCWPIVLVRWADGSADRWLPANYTTPVTQPFD